MTQLTEERFKEILTKKLAPLATKQDVRDGVEELARMVSDGFEQIKSFELKFQKLEEALHIKL